MVMAAKLTGLTRKIAIQLHLVAESCTICSSRSRRPVRKLLDIPSCYADAAKEKKTEAPQKGAAGRPFANNTRNLSGPKNCNRPRWKERVSHRLPYSNIVKLKCFTGQTVRGPGMGSCCLDAMRRITDIVQQFVTELNGAVSE
jgi:hypothetical protein